MKALRIFNLFKRKKKQRDYGRMPDTTHDFCLSIDQLDQFALANPDFTIKQLARLRWRSFYFRDLGVKFHYVGTRIFIEGLGFDDEYPEYNHEESL